MFSGFDAYVINLPSRPDRLAEFQRQAPGVRVFQAVRPTDAGGFYSIGARGCFLSHLAVLRMADIRPLLIFEDDAQFCRGFDAAWGVWKVLLDRVPWGIFYGGYRLDEPEDPCPPDRSIETAHMLALQPDVARRLADYLYAMLGRQPGDALGGPMSVDGAYSWFRRNNPDVITRLAIPQLARQRHSRTDVAGPSLGDRILPRTTAAVRRARNRLGL